MGFDNKIKEAVSSYLQSEEFKNKVKETANKMVDNSVILQNIKSGVEKVEKFGNEIVVYGYLLILIETDTKEIFLTIVDNDDENLDLSKIDTIFYNKLYDLLNEMFIKEGFKIIKDEQLNFS